jgi:succinoglycan biosynthesis protein ExoW
LPIPPSLVGTTARPTNDATRARIAVLIPFYQEQQGILARALGSVFAQKGVSDVHIVIVDDSSPVAAKTELSNFSSPRFPVTLVKQGNAGPGTARNRGLESLPSGTRYVAFLDSDDEWTSEHLARAILALSQGYDFYFADFLQLGQTIGAFARAGRVVPAKYPRLAVGDDLHAYIGDMFDQIITGNVIGTSTVVFDFLRFSQIRFRDDFRRAGEDYLCWMDFAIGEARFAFSSRCEARYGRGVNVYSGAASGTVQHLVRVQDELKYRKETLRLYPTTRNQRWFLKQKIGELREAFARDVVHLARATEPFPFRILRDQLTMDPLTLLAPLNVLSRRLSDQ